MLESDGERGNPVLPLGTWEFIEAVLPICEVGCGETLGRGIADGDICACDGTNSIGTVDCADSGIRAEPEEGGGEEMRVMEFSGMIDEPGVDVVEDTPNVLIPIEDDEEG